MKQIGEMSYEELAGFVCDTLRKADITVTLTGGACVAIWSKGRYVSHDLDFIEEGPVPRRKIREILGALGFAEKGRHFVHPETSFFVEFPNGPLMVGNQRVEKVEEKATRAGTLRLLSPTDCVKDRLAAYYHWKDLQSLDQALMVARARRINLSEIRAWSAAEGQEEKFREFNRKLRSSRRKR